jgi:putative heme-binding domain-containing protein
MAKLGRGRMPHIGSELVDREGLRLVHDWIRQLPVRKLERALLERLLASDGRPTERDEVVTQLLASVDSALLLVEAIEQKRLPKALCEQVVEAATKDPRESVRDLFERFLPDERRVRRLGAVILPQQLLSLKGDVTRGRELFLKAGSLCINCHKVGSTGGAVGPDLSQIGKKYNKAQILESILDPSKAIDPPYVAYVLETTDGRVFTGVLASKTEREIVLRDAEAKEVRIAAEKVAALLPQKKSLMPEQLLRDLTAEQAADLLEFLTSLK